MSSYLYHQPPTQLTTFTMVAHVQKPAPDFSGPAVVDGLITEISSKDLLGQWVVLFFYPMYVLYSSPNCNFGLNACVRARRVYLLISRVFNLNLFRDFTFVCPTEILAFNDSLEAFKELNTAVLGASRSCSCATQSRLMLTSHI